MIMLILEGIPLFLIELGIGQKMRLGSLGVWNTIHPWLGGIGISSCIVTLFVALYYNVIITWCFFYLFNSFRVRPIKKNFRYEFYQFSTFFFSSNFHGPNVLCSTKRPPIRNANQQPRTFGIVPLWMLPHRWMSRVASSGGLFCACYCLGLSYSSLS